MLLQPWHSLLFFFFFFYITIPLCHSHSSISPQNIETFYPFSIQTINNNNNNNENSSSDNVIVVSLPPPKSVSFSISQPTSKKSIVTIVIATAISTLLLSLFLFFFIQRFFLAKHKEKQEQEQDSSSISQSQRVFQRLNGNFNGFILEENGLDVVYWAKSVWRKSKKSLLNLKNEQNQEQYEQERKSECIQETPLLHRRSSSTIAQEIEITDQSSSRELPWLPPPVTTGNFIKRRPPPPPPPNIQAKNLLAPRNPGPGQSSAGGDHDVKLKPLHWDKVNTNVNHSMAWDKINGGSFRFNGDLMEALFGYVATNKKSPTKQTNSTYDGRRAQISILDSRRSQNIAIILKSLTLSRQELHDALMEGQGLEPDILEKLVRIAPNQEEESQILAYKGDPLKLADAESFIFHLLKAIPTAFTRLNAMLFRSNYKSEVLHLMDLSQTLELGCEELQKTGLFTKLLEATLKAGNRMNSGTTRGNAQAFNLNSLLKLTDVKSTNGKTTLLHFVVEEVVISEGKKRFFSNNPNSISKREREAEYTKLGLEVVESLSSEFSNVKKASEIDYKSYITAKSQLSAKISEISEMVRKEEGEYKRKMMGFVKTAEEELKMVSREEKRVMEKVKKTNEYYNERGEGNGENPFEIFSVVREFVRMVDQVSDEIGGNSRKKSKREAGLLGMKKSVNNMRFSCLPLPLPEHLMCKSIANQSESTDEDL